MTDKPKAPQLLVPKLGLESRSLELKPDALITWPHSFKGILKFQKYLGGARYGYPFLDFF